jgi:phenylacetate-CoA ligase
MFWSQHEETLSRKELEKLQLTRLKALMKNVSNHPLYGKYENIRLNDLTDLQKLPFTTKKDIQAFLPFAFFNKPLKEIVRIHTTSGTASRPIVVGYTAQDIKTWSDLTARVLTAGGLTRQDIVQNTFNYGLQTQAFGMQLGVERIGANIIPSSFGNTLRQIGIIQNLKPTALLSTPNYALQIIEMADKHALGIRRFNLKTGFFSSEAWSEKMRARIESKLNIKAFDNYCLTEVFGPGIAYECPIQDGMHVSEDHFIVEVINPDTGQVLSPGEKGELVFTTLTKQGFPVIRFRSGDISRIIPDQCACGRTFQRIERITGRTDDLFTVNGTNIFPSQIEDLLGDEQYATFNYEILVESEDHKDRLTVLVETPHLLRKHPKEILIIEKEMAGRLRASLGVNLKVKLLKPGAIIKCAGRKARVIDTRRG